MYPECHLENMQLVILSIETLFASCFHTFLCLLSIFNGTQGRYKTKGWYKILYLKVDIHDMAVTGLSECCNNFKQVLVGTSHTRTVQPAALKAIGKARSINLFAELCSECGTTSASLALIPL